MLAVTDHALEGAYARVILNPILICLVSEEKTPANEHVTGLGHQHKGWNFP
jgi:hypothetical protein